MANKSYAQNRVKTLKKIARKRAPLTYKFKKKRDNAQFLNKMGKFMEVDSESLLPKNVGFDHIIESLRRKKREKEDLGEFEGAYSALLQQLKMSSYAELLFFFRTNIAKAESENKFESVKGFLTGMLAEDAVTGLEDFANRRYGVTRDQLMEKVAFLMNYKKLQRNVYEKAQKQDRPLYNPEFLEKDPFFGALHPEARKELRNAMSTFENGRETFHVTPDFEDFDFEGLTADDFSAVEADIQKKYFHKKASLLPEVLGVNPKKFYKIAAFADKIADKLDGSMRDELLLMDSHFEYQDLYQMFGWSEEFVKNLRMRVRKSNQRNFEVDDQLDKFERHREVIPQLEEHYDYTPLKEILYSFDTMKTLESKITKLEKETKMYDMRQPRVAELQKKLDMLLDRLPAHIRKIIFNRNQSFVPQFVGKEYAVKGLRWKMMDKDVPGTLLDYTDSTPDLPTSKLHLFSPFELNKYLDELFPWTRPGDINFRAKQFPESSQQDEVSYYMGDLVDNLEAVTSDNFANEIFDGSAFEEPRTLKQAKSEHYGETEMLPLEGYLGQKEVELYNKHIGKPGNIKLRENKMVFKRDTNEFVGYLDTIGQEMDKSFFVWPQVERDLYSQHKEREYYGNLDDEVETYEKVLDVDRTVFQDVFELDDDFDLKEHEFVAEHTPTKEDLVNDFDQEYKEIIDDMNKPVERSEMRKGIKPGVEDMQTLNYIEKEEYNKKGASLQEKYADLSVENVEEEDDIKDLDTRSIVDGVTLGEGTRDFLDLNNVKGRFSLNLDQHRRNLQDVKFADMMNPRDNVLRQVEHEDPYFFQFQKQLAITVPMLDDYNESEFFYEIYVVKDSTEHNQVEVKKSEILPNYNKARTHFKKHFMHHLKEHLISKSITALTGPERREVEIYRQIDKDPYYQHYMSNNFRNMALINSEMFLETMGESKNPDLGFLLDSRINMKKMAMKHRPSRSIIMDLKSKYDISGLEFNKTKKETYRKTSRITAFASAHRKRASALAVIQYPGSGKVLINRRKLTEYFYDNSCRYEVIKPIAAANKLCQVDIKMFVHGGGFMGQSQASRLAVSKAIMKIFPISKGSLIKHGYLRVDLRSVEAKKTGKIKARKDYTYVRR